VKKEFSVSIIVPVRDEAESISRFIESLLQQSYPPQEIILADGGSVDETKTIIQSYIKKGHALRLVEDANAYPGRGRNLAIAAAQTEWVAMTDAGTEVSSDWLGKLIFEADDADIVLGTYEPILSTFFKECLALAFIAIPIQVGDKYVRGPSTASMMIRKRVWEELGRFPEDLRACEDLLFFERMSASAFRTHYAPDAVVQWHIAGDFSRVFRRFRAYSLHTLKAGLGATWHLGVGRLYVAGAIFVALAVLHSWYWLLFPLTGLGLRVHRTITKRRSFLRLNHRIGLRSYLLVGVILVWIDLAMFAGLFDWLRKAEWKT